jgi:hypothetical protein
VIGCDVRKKRRREEEKKRERREKRCSDGMCVVLAIF